MNWTKASDNVNKWIKETCKRCGYPKFYNGITWEWNKRFTWRLGDANYGKLLIRLSYQAWPLLPQHERKDTVVHEVCHLLTYYGWRKNFRSDWLRNKNRPSAHGKEWKEMMKRAGIKNPQRCSTTDLASLSRGKEVFICNCKEHKVGEAKAARIDKRIERYKKSNGYARPLSLYYCQDCKGFLRRKDDKAAAKGTRGITSRRPTKATMETAFERASLLRDHYQYSYSVIAVELNGLGCRTKRGKKFRPQTVRAMLLKARQ